MDIRNVLHAILPANLRSVERSEKPIKMDSATDRDGNGQMPFGDQSGQHHQPMNEEQFKKCMDHLRELEAVKNHSLSVEEYLVEKKRFVLLKEPNGKLIRRISEDELWTLIESKEEQKGQLLRKTA